MNKSTFTFDNTKITSSGGIYSLIVKTVVESNGIDIEDLRERYEKNSWWYWWYKEAL